MDCPGNSTGKNAQEEGYNSVEVNCAVPFLQGLLNKDNIEKRKNLRRLFDDDSLVSSEKRERLEQRNLVNYVSNVDVIT